MDIITNFQALVAQVHELVQPLIIALAGAIPYVEGHGAVLVGVLGGVHPAVAFIAAIAGNFLCVAALVFLSSGVRTAVVARARGRAVLRSRPTQADAAGAVEPTARRAKFQRAFGKYGVPGVSLLGPLLLPTQLIATMLVSTGVSRGRVLAWQAVAIVGWTVLVGVVAGGLLSLNS